MRLKADTTRKEDLQAGRAWGALGFKIADEIDRAMCAADGLAALQRAADLVTLWEWISTHGGGLFPMFVTLNQDGEAVKEFWNWDDASDKSWIAEAAAWVRQRGGA
jgi:hypothetical protein